MSPSDDHPVRLIPLGGLGEFGLNAMVLECGGDMLLLDAGVLFPPADMPGIDSIVPDFAYLSERRDRLRGILLTHGHEDHIGALAFALKAAPAPVYGSRLTLGFVRRRLAEREVSGTDLRLLTPGQPVEMGAFRVHPIPVAHSVSDSLALAIETPAGVVITSGDFKIDLTAAEGQRTDLDALSAWGDRGVLALLADSTNAEHAGRAGSEDDVLPAFEEVFARTEGKVLVSCFATAIPRIQRVSDMARRHGRKVTFIGRRMSDNTDVATELGLLSLPADSVVAANAASSVPSANLLAFVSGSQGEPLSALSLMSIGEQRDLRVGEGDTAVIAARPIPGNERAVSRVMGNLFRRGCDVVHGGTAKVHVSGHGNRDDLVELLQRVRPQWLIPVHGEYRMLAQHARLAAQAGFPSERVQLIEDGDVLELGRGGARRGERVAAARVMLDRSRSEGVEDMVVRDRRHLSSEGIVVPVVVLDRHTGELQSAPEIVTRGFVDSAGSSELLDDASRSVAAVIEGLPVEERNDAGIARERIRTELRRFFKKRTQRRPMVIPVVMEV